ncbi:hypothetical protein GCM10010220_27240 [Streptomyces parvulus]|nr:hypothetical protein GCM10010220_27240 [Streptomyces parvulus]
MTGTSRVCITATTMPAKASTGTVALLALRVGSSVVVWDMGWGLQAGGRRNAVGRCGGGAEGSGLGSEDGGADRRADRVRMTAG